MVTTGGVAQWLARKYPSKFVLDPSAAKRSEYPRSFFLRYLRGGGPSPTPLGSNGVATIRIFASLLKAILETKLGSSAVVVGVLKKGRSLLTELQEQYPELKKYTTISNSDIEIADLSGRPVVVLDDSLQRGITIASLASRIRRRGAKAIVLATLVSREDGIREAEQVVDEIVCPFPVTGPAFSHTFSDILVPALSSMKRGTIADRAFVDFNVTPVSGYQSPGVILREVLCSLVEMPMTDQVLETLRADGQPEPGFSATVILSQQSIDWVLDSLRAALPDTPGISWIKLRLFPCMGTPFSCRLCAILHPDWDGDLPTEFPKVISATDLLLTRASTELFEGLRVRGFVSEVTSTGRLIVDQS